jgi:LPS-assembly protein
VAAAEPEPAKRIDQGLDWGQCSPPAPTEITPLLLQPGKPGILYLDAEGAEYDQANQLIRLYQAALRQDDTYLEADRAIYYRRTKSADLEQDIYLQRPDLRLTSDIGQMDLDDYTGWFSAVEYRLPEIQGRGTAEQAEILSKTRSEYERVIYTTCPPGSRDWSLSAREMDIDQETGWGNAYHAILRLGKLPVFYTPYFNFPIDDRRKSGFLFPTFGSSKDLGTEFSIPYYFNLAPDYDATLTPRWMSERGLMLEGEFRFLGERQSGTLWGQILNDKVESDLHGSRRSALRITHKSNPFKGLTTRINASEVSDMEYLNDFSTGLNISSIRYLERLAEARYTLGNWRLTGQLQDLQSVDPNLNPRSYPYSLLPRLMADYHKLSSNRLFDLGLKTEYTYFRHDIKSNGQRLRLSPGLGVELFRRPWGFLIPRLMLYYAGYQLDEDEALTDEVSDPAYTVPTLSLDGGLVFERASSWFGSAATQTLEPRLYYLYAPYEDQSDIPDFDTSDLELSYSNLFKDNRFIGGDRVGDANQVAFGVTTRWLEDDSGLERLRASIGQIFYFQDREVQLLSRTPTQEQTASAVVAELSSRLGSHWRASLALRWDPELEENEFDRRRVGLHYRSPKQRLFNVGYNFDAKNEIEDVDLSFYWRFDHRFTAIAAWKHSLFHQRDLNRVAGFEYGGRCCWKLRAVYQEYVKETDLDENIEQEADTRFMLQLELGNLGTLGTQIRDTLKESIYGYQPEQ